MNADLNVHARLSEFLQKTSQTFYDQLDTIPPDLIEWSSYSGLSNGTAELRRVLALQASLAQLLVVLLRYLHPDDELGYRKAKSALDTLPFNNLISCSATEFHHEDLKVLTTELHSTPTGDELGRLYEELTPQDERRTLGQHWTPRPIAELMVSWAIRAGQRILDPAVGSGRFVQTFEQKLTHRSVADEYAYLRAYELSPLVLLIAQVNAALSSNDSVLLDFRPGDFLKAPAEPEAFDAVICNPPYTRHHHLSADMKDFLISRAHKEFGVRPSRLTSLFVYFFIQSILFVRAGGHLAFITPSELYEASYSEPFKRILKKSVEPTAIITFDKSHKVFDGVDTAGCVTLARKGKGTNSRTALVEVTSWPGAETIMEAIEMGEDRQFDWGKVRFVPVQLLEPSAKWSNIQQMAAPINSLPPLCSIAKIVRGVATGANKYFCLSHEEARQHGIPDEYLVPVITQARVIQNYRLDLDDIERLGENGRKVWLFNCQSPRDQVPREVRAYIERGEQLGLHERSLLKLKKGKWYMVERRDPPPILYTYLGRSNTRFIYNAAGAQALNVFLLIYPEESIAQEPSRVQALVAILNSLPIKRQLHLVGRSYGGDTVKLEPREMDKLPILDPRLLSSEEIIRINSLFEDLYRAPTDIVRQSALDEEVSNLIFRYNGMRFRQAVQDSLFPLNE